MNDAEIEAAILAAHHDRVAEVEGTEEPASTADEAMEQPVEEHYSIGLPLQADNDQVFIPS